MPNNYTMPSKAEPRKKTPRKNEMQRPNKRRFSHWYRGGEGEGCGYQ